MDSAKFQVEEDEKLSVMCLGDNLYAPYTFPFTLKLVTYLRMTNIKHEVVSCVLPKHSYKELPYIKFHGKSLTDTTFILPHLNSVLSKDLDSHLNPEEKSISLAFQKLVEESLCLTLMYQMWVMDDTISETFVFKNVFQKCIFSKIIRFALRLMVKDNLKKHGIGCRSHDEIIDVAQKDLQSLSDFLGKKSYFMGEKPSEVDATVFAFVAIAMYVLHNSPSGKFILNTLPNLVSYVERMKTTYWPDWDDLCSKPIGEKICETLQLEQEKKVIATEGVIAAKA